MIEKGLEFAVDWYAMPRAASMAKSSVSRSMAAEDMDAAGARSSITRKLDLGVASIQAERQRAINRTADIGRRTVAYSNQH